MAETPKEMLRRIEKVMDQVVLSEACAAYLWGAAHSEPEEEMDQLAGGLFDAVAAYAAKHRIPCLGIPEVPEAPEGTEEGP